MATFTATPTSINDVMYRTWPNTGKEIATLKFTGSVAPGTITLTKVGGAAWLTIPATAVDDTEFSISLDRHKLPGGKATYRNVTLTETIRASSGAVDDKDVVVTIKVRPGGFPPNA